MQWIPKPFMCSRAPVVSVYQEFRALCARNWFWGENLKGKLGRYQAVELRNLSLYWLIWGTPLIAYPRSFSPDSPCV